MKKEESKKKRKRGWRMRKELNRILEMKAKRRKEERKKEKNKEDRERKKVK